MYKFYFKKTQIVKFFYFFIFLFFVSKPSFCQTANYEFIGSLLYNNMKDHIIYKVMFTEVNGTISGYSITDLGGKYETKTAIKGILNKKNGKITFNETKVISTKYKQDESNLCFVNAKCLLKNFDKKTVITGTFNGFYLKDKQLCASGKVMLVSSKNLYQDLLKTMNSLPENNLKDSIRKITEYSMKPLNDIKEVIEAKGNTLVSYHWKSDTVKITTWDDAAEDGDMISITQNGVEIIANYIVTRKRKEIKIPLKKGIKNVFKITAINVGAYQPNTAKILFTDKQDSKLFMTYLSKGEFFEVNVEK
jgi:hypothetical protein